MHKPYTYKEAVFIPKYRNLTIKGRERKCALEASNKGECWWVYQFLITNPNRMVGKW